MMMMMIMMMMIILLLLLLLLLPSISILCYFLVIAYVYALNILQNVIFPMCFRSSNLSFRHGFPSLNL